MALNVDSLTAALESTHVSLLGLSFAQKSWKLDTEEQAKPITDAIDKCKELNYLNLEGNTLGVEACKAIAKALETHPEFKRALWKDMFTGRMKTEIPIALEHLGNGLLTAGAKLTELDMSDNAFGPIGVKGLAAFLRSSSCYALEELRLNNNGLGITGGKLLANALMDCYQCSKNQGKPLALKVFIAGRNRLENEGATALAQVFKAIGTLEEIAMPQNGIYHVGMTALSEAFKHNKNLQVLNLNDNTIGPKGAKAISSAMMNLQKLHEINFGDCLLKTKGAEHIANGLLNCNEIKTITLSFNEITPIGGNAIVEALKGKTKLETLILDGNNFGFDAVQDIKEKLKSFGLIHTLGSFDEDESAGSEDEADTDSASDNESENEETEKSQFDITVEEIKFPILTCTIDDFISSPTTDRFLGIGENGHDLILTEMKNHFDVDLEKSISIIMKVAALTVSPNKEAADNALKCSEILYRELFSWANKTEKLSIVNNTLLIDLGLIKSEDKKHKPTWNLDGCFKALESIIKKNYIPSSTKETLKVFVALSTEKHSGDVSNAKQKLLSALT